MKQIRILTIAAVLTLNFTICMPARAQSAAESEELSGQAPLPGDVPVDGGLSLLLAAGAAYGVRRVRRGRR
jgi:hypothetical protein